jgi:CBS domain-containing protein
VLVAALLRSKGDRVVTITPEASVADLLDVLARENVGAAVVSSDGETLDGIVSERDVVRHLERSGAALLAHAVATIMTREVHTCGPDSTVEHLMTAMTEHRVRHLPVVDGERMVGIVSIGDVVKSRLGELEGERDDLVHYITRGG